MTAQSTFARWSCRSLMKGVSARVLYTIPSSAILISSYELVKTLSLRPEYRA